MKSLFTAIALSTLLATGAIAAEATMQTATDYRTTKLVGTNVYNAANENIGEINDIIVDKSGSTKAVVVSVGGFLGMGTRYVAVPFSSLKTARDSSGTMKVTMDGTKDTLKAMPEFQFYKG